MSRLGRIVALAGKNGAGKTRILTAVETLVNIQLNRGGQIDSLNSDIAAYKRAIEQQPHRSDIAGLIDALKRMESDLLDITTAITCGDNGIKFKSIRFVPKNLSLQDPESLPKAQLKERFQRAKALGVEGYDASCLFYVQVLQDRHWNAEHQKYSGSDAEKTEAIDQYISFQKIVQRLLGTELERDIDGTATLYGKPVSKSGLSDGQKIILQLCVALHAQRSDLDNTVFLLDEPENHLHPSAVIDLVKTLYELTKSSQIWIATHSVPLLSYVASIDPMCLWYVEEGKATHAGRRPELVLGSLLGDDEQIYQLNSFTSLPAQLAAINYANESLLPPAVLSRGGKDPQVGQLQRMLSELGSGSRLSILDFGAGKGRLLDGLGEEVVEQGGIVEDFVDYYAYDPFPDGREMCEQVIRTHFSDKNPRYFASRDEFFSYKDSGSISVVVMCNVLHEIPPNKWIDLFSPDQLIHRSLRDDGYLLVIEDQRIPVGEKAHQFGFIVLDTSHLRTLFKINSEDVESKRFIIDDARNDGRLKGHLIAKSLLGRVTSESRKNAISQVNQTARENIMLLRELEPSYSNGQLHGFWTQQFANSALALSEL